MNREGAAGAGGSDVAPGAVLGQGVHGRGLLQQSQEDALQLGEAGTQRGAGEEPELEGRVEGQDGDEPPAPHRAVGRSLQGREGENPASGAARRGGARPSGGTADGEYLLRAVRGILQQCLPWLRRSSEQPFRLFRHEMAG